jgi:hypothetical protein
VIVGLLSFRDAAQNLIEAAMTGQIGSLQEAFSSSQVFVGSALAVLIVIVFLMVYGTFVDMAQRTGFFLGDRKRFLVSPVLFTLFIGAAFIPLTLEVISALLKLRLNDLIIWIIPSLFAILGILIVIGAIPLWLLHRKDNSIIKALLLSGRLLFSPLIDLFWSGAASFVGVAIATPLLWIAVMVTILTTIGQFKAGLDNSNILNGIINAFTNVIGYATSNSALLAFLIPYVVIGGITAFYIHADGPSKAMAGYFKFMSILLPISTVIGAIVLYTYIQSLGLIYWILIIVPLIVVCVGYFIACQISAFLIETFRIAGLFGLAIIIASLGILALFFGIIPNIPLIGSLITGVITTYLPWVNTVALEIGVAGFAIGAIVLILALAQKEEKTVFSEAMSLSVGLSTILPFIFVAAFHLPGILGGILGSLLVFVLISPTYLLMVSLLRIRLALNPELQMQLQAQVNNSKTGAKSSGLPSMKSPLKSSFPTIKKLIKKTPRMVLFVVIFTAGFVGLFTLPGLILFAIPGAIENPLVIVGVYFFLPIIILAVISSQFEKIEKALHLEKLSFKSQSSTVQKSSISHQSSTVQKSPNSQSYVNYSLCAYCNQKTPKYKMGFCNRCNKYLCAEHLTPSKHECAYASKLKIGDKVKFTEEVLLNQSKIFRTVQLVKNGHIPNIFTVSNVSSYNQEYQCWNISLAECSNDTNCLEYPQVFFQKIKLPKQFNGEV